MRPGAVAAVLFIIARAAGAAVVTPVPLSPVLPLGGAPAVSLGGAGLAGPLPGASACSSPLPSLSPVSAALPAPALPAARAFDFASFFHRPAAARTAPKAAGTLRAAAKKLSVPGNEDASHERRAAELSAAFDGADADAVLPDAAEPRDAPIRPSRPGYQPHRTVPKAVLPDGQAIGPDSFEGGFHGTGVSPEKVVAEHGFPARASLEDWRLLEHSEEEHPRDAAPSAFRGTTGIVSSQEGTGAAYWADEGGWVYEIRGVPTWDLNSDLFGRVFRGGRFRGNLMSQEAENAVPAEFPLECIVRWGQVETRSGTPLVPEGNWSPNPYFDPSICARYFGL